MTRPLILTALLTPALLTGCSAHSSGAVDGPVVVARVSGEEITQAELDETIAQDLYDLRKSTLDQMIAETVIKAQAEAAGLSPEALIEARLAEKIPPVEEEVARNFYEMYGDQLGPELAGKPFEEVSKDIIEGMTAQLREKAVPQVLEDLLTEANAQILLAPPRIEVEALGYSKGPEDASIVIVEFSDFECPYCTRGRVTMEQVLATYPKDVRVVFRDFPLPFHPNAKGAAEAGRCAGEQGDFWGMHDWMFANQGTLTTADLVEGGASIGLDGDAMAACLEEGRYASDVEMDIEKGQELGVQGTPAFFVNGIRVSGAQPYEVFKEVIDGELMRAQVESD